MGVITVTIYPAAHGPSSLAVWKEDDGFCCHSPRCLNNDIDGYQKDSGLDCISKP